MKRKVRKIYLGLGLIMVVFSLALSGYKPSFSLSGVTGKVIDVDVRKGCVENIFNDGTILKIIKPKLKSVAYNAVVIKDDADYYLLAIHDGKVIDSNGKPYKFAKGDIVCYENFPKAIEVFT